MVSRDGLALLPVRRAEIKEVETLLKFVIDYEKALERGLPEPQVPRFDEEGNVVDEN